MATGPSDPRRAFFGQDFCNKKETTPKRKRRKLERDPDNGTDLVDEEKNAADRSLFSGRMITSADE